MKDKLEETTTNQELLKAKMVISLFINSCSHTMRGPLKSIEGLVNLLYTSKNYSESESKLFLDLIQSTVLKLEATLDELEHLLKNSQQAVAQRPVDFNQILKEILSAHTQVIERAGVCLEANIEQTTAFYTDASRLRIILSHIIDNAIQFRDETKEKMEIYISIKTTEANCIIAVSDNGIGIAPENHARIFELFFRASQKSKGTGVSLYVVNDMLAKMNGSISVDAVPHKGSVFTISIPNLLVA